MVCALELTLDAFLFFYVIRRRLRRHCVCFCSFIFMYLLHLVPVISFPHCKMNVSVDFIGSPFRTKLIYPNPVHSTRCVVCSMVYALTSAAHVTRKMWRKSEKEKHLQRTASAADLCHAMPLQYTSIFICTAYTTYSHGYYNTEEGNTRIWHRNGIIHSTLHCTHYTYTDLCCCITDCGIWKIEKTMPSLRA